MDGTVREVRARLVGKLEAVEGPVLLAPHAYGPDRVYVLGIGFRSRIREGKPNGRRGGVRWISMEEIDDTEVAWEHDRGFARAALEDAQSYTGPLACPARA